MVRVFLPPLVRELTEGKDEVEAEGSNVRQVVASLEARFPGIRDRLCVGDDIKPGLAVAVDGQVSQFGLWQPVGENSEIQFLPAIGGG